ncbi:MAG: hypothetical protein ABSH20_31735, partial [Tepidisphaeraceae bacterium]
IKGASTVIAQIDPSRYAFFRGKTDLAPPKPVCAQPACVEKPAGAAAPPAPAPKMEAGKADALLENVKGFNKARQDIQVEQMQKMYKSKDEGVKAEKAF